MALLLWLALAGCSPSPQSPVATPPSGAAAFRATLTSPAAQACLDTACGTDADFKACFVSRCPERKASWAVVPEKVNWEASTRSIFVQTHVSYRPGGWGNVDEVRKDAVFVGVTLIAADGEEMDLAVQTRFATELEEPFFLATSVSKPARDLIIGLWDHKIEPCDSSRSGCRDFGFVLDGPLASWPPDFYSTLERQRIPPARILIQPINGGVEPRELQRQADLARVKLEELLKPFGTLVALERPRPAIGTVTTSKVRFHDPHDAPIARMLAQGIEGNVTSEPSSEPAGDVLDLVIGASGAR